MTGVYNVRRQTLWDVPMDRAMRSRKTRKGGRRTTRAGRVGEEVATRSADRYAGRSESGKKRRLVRVRSCTLGETLESVSQTRARNCGDRPNTEPEAERRWH